MEAASRSTTFTRWRLLEGLDDIGLTLRHTNEIDAYERAGPRLPSVAPTGRANGNHPNGLKRVPGSADGKGMSSPTARTARLIRRRKSEPAERREDDVLVASACGTNRSAATSDSWLDRWMATVADLARLKESHPMLDAVIDEQVGRRIRIGDHWLADFASCNYLGFDLDQEIIDAVPEYVAKWGTHPSWSRLLGSPVMYEQIEASSTELLGCEDTLLLPTITHIHMSVIPVLAGSGVIFLDGRAHKTIYDGAMIARGHGATDPALPPQRSRASRGAAARRPR